MKCSTASFYLCFLFESRVGVFLKLIDNLTLINRKSLFNQLSTYIIRCIFFFCDYSKHGIYAMIYEKETGTMSGVCLLQCLFQHVPM